MCEQGPSLSLVHEPDPTVGWKGRLGSKPLSRSQLKALAGKGNRLLCFVLRMWTGQKKLYPGVITAWCDGGEWAEGSRAKENAVNPEMGEEGARECNRSLVTCSQPRIQPHPKPDCPSNKGLLFQGTVRVYGALMQLTSKP